MAVSELHIRNIDGGIELGVKVVPGSSRTTLAGIYNGMLKIKLAAAPEKGKANQCLIEYLAKCLKVKRSCVSIISGATNPTKKLKICSVEPEKILGRLNNLIGSC